MNQLTNISGIPLTLAVYLGTDEYDHEATKDKKSISVTTLIKPIKQVILSSRVPEHLVSATDVLGMFASRNGTALHNGVESSWINNYKETMEALGHPKKVIERIAINPDPDFLKTNPKCIPIYLEIRSDLEIDGYTISGKFDVIADGVVEDVKSTKTYTYVKGVKTEDYVAQLSIYRLLNKDKATGSFGRILFLFMDWAATRVYEKGYPPSPALGMDIPLWSLEATEAYIRQRIRLLETNWDLDQELIPPCTTKELWQDPPKYKYYKDPTKTSRSTKNFDNIHEAITRQNADNNVGIVKTVESPIRACAYCAGKPICQQAKNYEQQGLLK